MESDGLRPRSFGGHDPAAKSFRPLRTKMRVPSFLTKSGSSTPATCVLVVVHDEGLEDPLPLAAGPAPAAGPPPLSRTTPPPAQGRRHMLCGSSCRRCCELV